VIVILMVSRLAPRSVKSACESTKRAQLKITEPGRNGKNSTKGDHNPKTKYGNMHTHAVDADAELHADGLHMRSVTFGNY
jgi:hypothetical protein